MTLAFAVLGGPGVRLMTGLAEVREQAMTFLPYIVALPLVSVWAFVFDGIYFGATRTAELRNGMAAALAAVRAHRRRPGARPWAIMACG